MYTIYHPSKLAHAHMTISLIFYYRSIILRIIDAMLENGNLVNTIMNIRKLRLPVFVENDYYDTTCWTAVTFDFNNHDLKHSLFALSANKIDGFLQSYSYLRNVPEE